MKRSVRLLGLALALAIAGTVGLVACVQVEARDPGSSEPTPTATAESNPAPTASPTTEPTPGEPTATPTTGPMGPTATPTVNPFSTPTQLPVNNVGRFGLYLQIEGLGENNETYSDTIVVKGQTAADAIVSINTVIVPVDSEGRFEMAIRLKPGAQEIVVVASNLAGEDETKTIDIVRLSDDGGSL